MVAWGVTKMTFSPRQAILEQVHRFGGSSPGPALGDRRAASLVVNTMFRALAGRYPDARERESLIRHAAEGASFDDLLGEVAATESAVDRTLDRIRPALQARLRWDYERRASASGTDSLRWALRQEEAGGAAELHDRVVFLHVMKTGGVSLSHVCLRWALARGRAWAGLFVDDLLLRPPAMLAQINFISGHIPYEALEVIPGSFKTAILLRDPVARAISHFSELRRSGPPYSEMTLDEFASGEDRFGAAGNYQTRQLAHRIGIAGAWTEYNPYQRLRLFTSGQSEYPVSSLFDTVPVMAGDDEMLDAARRNLSSIDFVGVTEDMSSVAGQIARVYGARPVSLPRMHVSPPFDRSQLTASVREKLEAGTALDRELYDLALRRCSAPGDPVPGAATGR